MEAYSPKCMTSQKGGYTSASIFWSALKICIFTSIFFFAHGYAESPHIKGSTNNTEFWFLLQSSITQIIGLGISALLERRNRSHQMRWDFQGVLQGPARLLLFLFTWLFPLNGVRFSHRLLV